MAMELTADFTVFGNKRICEGLINMTGVASGAVATGLNNVLFAAVSLSGSYTSGTTPMVRTNINSAATTAAGYIQVVGATAGDQLRLFAYGN